MAPRSASLDHIALLSQQAALDPHAWNELLGEVCRWVGAPSGVLFSPMPGASEPLLAANNAEWLASLNAYEAHWMAHDPWLAAAQRQQRQVSSGETTLGVELVPQSDYEGTAFYNDFGRPAGLSQMLSLRIADGTEGGLSPVTMISLHRAHGDEAFGAEHKALLAACWPHLRRGLDTHWAFRRARRFHGAVEGALEAMPQPVWVLRADGRIDHANGCARQLMHAAPWLWCSGERLLRIGDLEHDALRRILAPGVAAAGRHAATCVELGPLKPAMVRVAPLQAVEPYASAWPHACALLSLELPAESLAAAPVDRLAVRHRLTPTEREVLHRLARGMTLDQIGDELNVARNTVRTHLRNLFDKLGVRRQSELVRLALAG